MSADRLALVREYLREFVMSQTPRHRVNHSLNGFGDASPYEAVRCLLCGDVRRADDVLRQIEAQADKPVSTATPKGATSSPQEERQRIALAVKVARALLNDRATA
jgi:hypothetical protein